MLKKTRLFDMSQKYVYRLYTYAGLKLSTRSVTVMGERAESQT